MDDQLTRMALLKRGAVAAAATAGASFVVPGLAHAGTRDIRFDDQTGPVYLLQANFHRAKSHQDIDLMVSLWADDCTFTYNGTTYTGTDAVRTFFLGSGSWKHKRLSLVPSFKDQIQFTGGFLGNTGYIYFECHDVALDTNDPGGPQGSLVSHLYNAGTLERRRGNWLFHDMHFGAASLSVDTLYYP